MRVAHLALLLRHRHERGNGVDNDHVERPGTHQVVGDLERLLCRVRLRNEQSVDVYAEPLGVAGVHGVLGIDISGRAAETLRFRDHVRRQRRLAGRLCTEDFHHPAARQPANTERHVQGDRARRNHIDVLAAPVTQLHDGAATERLVDLREC